MTDSTHSTTHDTLLLSQPAPVWRRAALLLLLCAGLAAIAASESVHEEVLDLLAACESVIDTYPLLGPIAFILFAAASAMLAFISVAVIVPIGAYAWGAPLTTLYLWTGWLIGGLLSYAVGRAFGRSLLMWVSPRAAVRLERLVRHDGSFALVLLLQLSLPSELLGYALGTARYRFKAYVAVLALGELPYAIGAVVLGESFVAGQTWMLLFGGIVFSSLIIIVFDLLRRRFAHEAKQPAANPNHPTLSRSTKEST